LLITFISISLRGVVYRTYKGSADAAIYRSPDARGSMIGLP